MNHGQAHKAEKQQSSAKVAGIVAGLVFALPIALVSALVLNRNTEPHHGEEDTTKTVSFADIPQKGDPRIQHLIAKLRQSPEGEALYQYGARTGLKFHWGSKQLTAMGTYEHGEMTSGTGFSDDITLLTIAHETRHHWQHTAMDDDISRLEPLGQYAVKRLREVDACAYAAQFSANYKDATGHTLKTPTAPLGLYGGSIAMNYADKESSAREIFRDAYQPCMNAINHKQNYAQAHAKAVTDEVHKMKAVFNAGPSCATATPYRPYFNSPLISGTAKAIPLSDAALTEWVTDISRTPAAKAIRNAQNEYNALKK